jgi:hypothetical protein
MFVTVNVGHQGASRSVLQRVFKQGHELCMDHGLQPLVIGNAAAGGASDAQHFFGFGDDLSYACAPMVKPELQRTIQNMLDGGVEGWFPSVLQSAIPALDNLARAVLWYDGILRPEGLFPCCSPNAKVYCPLYKLKGRWLVWSLTIHEKLWLFQMPLSMDLALAGLNPT